MARAGWHKAAVEFVHYVTLSHASSLSILSVSLPLSPATSFASHPSPPLQAEHIWTEWLLELEPFMVLIASHVNRLHVSRQDYSIYVHTTSTMSSERHLDRDTRELSEF
jgi:hypothetical protein